MLFSFLFFTHKHLIWFSFLMLFAREPFLLHLLAGSGTITALDAAKALLDAGTHNANEREPCDNLAPLHVAAAWGNLAMCQLLVHYGADVKAEDIDKRRPVDVAEAQCRHFLKRLDRKRRTERSKFGKVLSFLFRCTHPATTADIANQSASLLMEPFTKGPQKRQQLRTSCPSIVLSKAAIRKISNVQQQQFFPSRTTASSNQTVMAIPPSRLNNQPAEVVAIGRPMPSAPPMPPPSTLTPRGPRRSSSLMREAFLTDDNTQSTDELNMARLEERRAELVENGGQTEDENEHDDNDDEALVALCHQFASLRLDELRERLRQRNCIAGPMNGGNRRIYETKLARLETRQHHKQQQQQNQHQQNSDPPSINRYSQSLRRMVLIGERGNVAESQRIGRKEEAQIRDEYAHSQPTKKEVSFFCYLLIDPTQLASDGPFLGSDVPFQHFLSAIFYVGKGKRSRPLQHLVQASKCRDFAAAKPSEQSEKLKRILSLWDRGEGVISQQLFCNIHSAEAHVREGAMIDAIGVDNLTNVVRGSFSGLAAKWSRKQIADFGAFLLREAHAIFQHERCRPIRETDLED